MSEFIRKAIQKSLLLKKKPHLAPKSTPVTDPANWEDAKSKLREILRANGGKPGPWLDDNGQMRLLTRRRVGMKRLKEFRYDAPSPQEERRGLLRTGLLAGGIAAAGGLAGLGLYKSGLSSYARRADRLEKLVRKSMGKGRILARKPGTQRHPAERPSNRLKTLLFSLKGFARSVKQRQRLLRPRAKRRVRPPMSRQQRNLIKQRLLTTIPQVLRISGWLARRLPQQRKRRQFPRLQFLKRKFQRMFFRRFQRLRSRRLLRLRLKNIPITFALGGHLIEGKSLRSNLTA